MNSINYNFKRHIELLNHEKKQKVTGQVLLGLIRRIKNEVY